MRQKFRYVLVLLAFACGLGAATAAATDVEPVPTATTATATTATMTATTATVQTAAQRAARRRAIRWLSSRVAAYQRETWRWQRLMGLEPAATHGRNLAAMNVADVRRAARLWARRARAARLAARRPPHLRGWLCIHRFEAGWRDRGAPYYGGLQMDWGFMRRYGAELLRRKGTADNWTPIEQIWVAERAHRSGRGFYPWPNTARYCGLI